MRKNVAGQKISAQMNKISDGTAATSGTTTVFYCIDGGTQGTGSGAVVHEGNGQWTYSPTQAETNGDHIAFTFANDTPAFSQTINVYPVSFDPTDAVRIGLTSLPNSAASGSGGFTFTNSGELDANAVSISGSSDAADNLETVVDTDWTESYNTVNNQWNVTLGGTPNVNVIQVSGSTAAADNMEVVFATDFSTNYSTTNDKWNTRADVISVSGSSTAADNIEMVFDTDFSTNYDTGNDKWQTEADVLSINGDSTSAANLALSTRAIIGGSATATTLSTTQMSTNLTEGTDSHYVGRVVHWLQNSSLHGQASLITAYNGTTKTLTYETVTESPSNGDNFVIV